MRQILYRFELNNVLKKRYTHLTDNNKSVLSTLNIIFSQLSSINHLIRDIKKLTIVKLYLLKTTRGKAQALGKPSRGQRT
jgi:ribosomal protein S13